MKEYLYTCTQSNKTYQIFTGQNGEDNWKIIKDANQNDIWFHVENISSTHVVLKIEDSEKVHKGVLNYCAGLAKQGSKAKDRKIVNIIYTEIRNVKINYKEKSGSVSTSKTKKLKV